jgi:hypothetical protein
MPQRDAPWVATPEDAAKRCQDVRHLCGLKLAQVRYFNQDYARWLKRPQGLVGPRLITDPEEWASPTWRYDKADYRNDPFDNLDYGVEFTTRDGRVFSVSSDDPHPRDSIGLREGRLVGTGKWEEATMAVWDVTSNSRWSPFEGETFTDVELHHGPFSVDPADGHYWPRITLWFSTSRVELVLGTANKYGRLCQSSEEVAVLFSPAELPAWTDRW